jgi:hypothetical protein
MIHNREEGFTDGTENQDGFNDALFRELYFACVFGFE